MSRFDRQPKLMQYDGTVSAGTEYCINYEIGYSGCRHTCCSRFFIMERMMNERPNYYAIIPANVRYDSELRANEKLMYGEITALANKTGECWASNQYFAELYGVTPQAVSKWISHLNDCGYINVEIAYKGNTKEVDRRIIRIVSTNVSEVSTNDCGGINKRLIPHKQKFKDNNTSKNNTRDNNLIYSQVVNYLNNRIGSRYNPKSGYIQRLITARMNDGYAVEDFYTVIDKKAAEWHGTKMAQYLRPQTLFGTKFEAYLNQPVSKTNVRKAFDVIDSIEEDGNGFW